MVKKRKFKEGMLDSLRWFKRKGNFAEHVVTNVAYFEKDGRRFFSPQDHCHIDMSRNSRSDWEYDYIITGLSRTTLGTKGERLCVDFLINRSVFKRAFISCDPNQVLRYRGFIVDPNVNKEYMCAAVIASRFIAERGSVVARTWLRMVRSGVDENAAFVLAHMFQYTYGSPVYRWSPKENHCALDGNHSFELKRMFLNYLNTDLYKDNLYYNDHTYTRINCFYMSEHDYRRKQVSRVSIAELKRYAKEVKFREKKDIFPRDNVFCKNYIDHARDSYTITIHELKQIADKLLEGVNYDWQQ